MSGITYNDLTNWAFLSDSLRICSSGVKTGFFKYDEHYERVKSFHDCLLKLNDRLDNREDFEIFSLDVNGIKYVDIQTRLYDYAQARKKDYSELLNKLVKDVENIVEKKTVKKLETLEKIIPYLQDPSSDPFSISGRYFV